MSWERVKARLLGSLKEAEDEGLVDPEILPALHKINSIDGLATSSSCFGRIIFIDVPTGIKKDSSFLYKWHRKISLDEFWDSIEKSEGEKVWFKFDPFILHISAKDIETAQKVLEAKNAAGIKRGGIFSIKRDRVQLEIEGTQRMEVPVKLGEKVLVSQALGKVLVDEANSKMKKNSSQLERFVKELMNNFR